MSYYFTSESVSEGHPDKVSDQISDALLDNFLAQDPNSKVACETLVTTGLTVLSGEVKTNGYVDVQKVAREVIRRIGYTKSEYQFDADSCGVISAIHEQSADIRQGVVEGEGLHEEQGAGDQGMMFGYACSETDTLMPAPIYYSHKILQLMAQDRKNGIADKLEPDSKSQVTMMYDNGKPIKVTSVVISTQHSPDVNQSQVKEIVRPYLEKAIPKELLSEFNDEEFYVNPTGQFIIGGPDGDSGLTGRKIIVDTYGGAAPHGGGAFSGKDPSKVDRSAAYAARYVAKNVVASKIADKCLIQLAYAIGVSKPLSIYVDLFDNDNKKSKHVENLIKDNFDLSPRGIREMLSLNKPIYECTSAYGHFGRKPRSNGSFSWEKTDKTEVFKN